MKYAFDACSSPVARGTPLQATIVALGLLACAAGCGTAQTPALAKPGPAESQLHPQTPQEWVQRNFPERSTPSAGQASPPVADEPGSRTNSASNLLAGRLSASPGAENTAAQATNTTPQAGPQTPSARPADKAAEPAPAASAPPKPALQALPPSSPTAPPVPAPAAAANPPAVQRTSSGRPDELLLSEGDVVRVSFPGAPTLNTVQQIRRDGNITLPVIGEFKAAGITLAQAEKGILKLYEPQLLDKEVTVTMDSSAFAVYVTGAVLRPGKILSDRPMSAMEAVVEAGIDHVKANLKKVRLIRQENGRANCYILNLKEALAGNTADSMKLKPSDVIYVPDRYRWF